MADASSREATASLASPPIVYLGPYLQVRCRTFDVDTAGHAVEGSCKPRKGDFTTGIDRLTIPPRRRSDAATLTTMVDSRGGPLGAAAVTAANTSRSFTTISPEAAMSEGAGQFYRSVAHELGHVYDAFYGPGVPIPRESGAYDQRITEDRAYLFEDGLRLWENAFKWQ